MATEGFLKNPTEIGALDTPRPARRPKSFRVSLRRPSTNLVKRLQIQAFTSVSVLPGSPGRGGVPLEVVLGRPDQTCRKRPQAENIDVVRKRISTRRPSICGPRPMAARRKNRIAIVFDIDTWPLLRFNRLPLPLGGIKELMPTAAASQDGNIAFKPAMLPLQGRPSRLAAVPRIAVDDRNARSRAVQSNVRIRMLLPPLPDPCRVTRSDMVAAPLDRMLPSSFPTLARLQPTTEAPTLLVSPPERENVPLESCNIFDRIVPDRDGPEGLALLDHLRPHLSALTT